MNIIYTKNHTKSKNSDLCGVCLYEKSSKQERINSVNGNFVWIFAQNHPYLHRKRHKWQRGAGLETRRYKLFYCTLYM